VRCCEAFKLTATAQRCHLETQKIILEDIFSAVLSQFKVYHPSGNLKFNYLGISQSLKLRILSGKILLLSPKLNLIANTLGCYGLTNQTDLARSFLF